MTPLIVEEYLFIRKDYMNIFKAKKISRVLSQGTYILMGIKKHTELLYCICS